MKAAKTPKHLKEIPYSPKKKLLKRKEKTKNTRISQTSSERLKLRTQTYQREIKRT